jgi:membrane protease YdiL (CAAX protease family)
VVEANDPRTDDSPVPAAPEPLPEPESVDPRTRGAELVRLALPFYGVVALFAFGYALFSGVLDRLFGESWPNLAGLGVGVGLGLALVVLSRVGARGWAPMARMTDSLAELIGPVRFWPAMALAFLSGTAEELLFRGALWPHLELPGTTLLFGLVHILPRRSLWVFPLFATLAGLLFGLLREGTQSVWPCVLAHVTVNALNLVWIGSLAARRGTDA